MLLGHFLGIVRVETFYLDLTFLIVAMLVIGGMRQSHRRGGRRRRHCRADGSCCVRSRSVSRSATTTIAAPAGLGDAILALIMLLIILFRPNGIAAGREFTWPFGRT